MSSIAPTYRNPNILCPEGTCNYQFLLRDLHDYDYTTYGGFADALRCPSCDRPVHPEDGVMNYFRHIDLEESPLHPLSIGGYCLNDTIDVPLGRTVEIGILQRINTTISIEGEEVHSSSVGLPLKAGIGRVWDSEGMSLEEMHGASIEPILGPAILLNDEIIADVDVVTEYDGSTKIAFLTSSRNGSIDEEVTFGYHLSLYSPRFQGPPWSELLREGIKTVYGGNPRTAYPAFITAFDNFLLRQLFRTAKLQGESKDEFETFIDSLRGWKNYVKEGLEEYTGERLTRNHTIYENFLEVRKRRNVELVHVSYDDDIPEITGEMATNDFKHVLRAMIEVYNICFEERQEFENS